MQTFILILMTLVPSICFSSPVRYWAVPSDGDPNKFVCVKSSKAPKKSIRVNLTDDECLASAFDIEEETIPDLGVTRKIVKKNAQKLKDYKDRQAATELAIEDHRSRLAAAKQTVKDCFDNSDISKGCLVTLMGLIIGEGTPPAKKLKGP